MINLNDLAKELTEVEGLLQEQSISDTKEFIAVLGMRWRDMPREDALKEFEAICERGGLHSEHNDV
jgi:hypothetical protein